MTTTTFFHVKRKFNKPMAKEVALTGRGSYTLMNDLLEEYFEKKSRLEAKRMIHKHNRRTLKMGYFLQYE